MGRDAVRHIEDKVRVSEQVPEHNGVAEVQLSIFSVCLGHLETVNETGNLPVGMIWQTSTESD